jgi:hypothetical protein
LNGPEAEEISQPKEGRPGEKQPDHALLLRGLVAFGMEQNLPIDLCRVEHESRCPTLLVNARAFHQPPEIWPVATDYESVAVLSHILVDTPGRVLVNSLIAFFRN